MKVSAARLSSCMKILYLAPHALWPLTTGARLRDFHCSRQLALQSELTYAQICAPDDPDAGLRPAEAPHAAVETLEKERSYTPGKIVRGLIGPLPLTVTNYTSAAAAARLKEILRKTRFDTVQIEGVHLSGYLPVLREAGARVICDWHNIESELMSRYAERESNLAKKLVAKRTAQLLRRTEIELLRTCPAHTVASERERDELLQVVPGARVEVIPNGIDVAHFETREDSGSKQALLFVGSMDYHANIDAVQWFAAEGWPALSARHSDMEFLVVGRSPNAAVRALAGGRLQVTGTVDDVRPYYGKAFAVAVPLRVGSGTRLKILEAMAAGVPVVSTRLGAEGIDAEHGRDILLADTPAEMVDALSLLYRDAELRSRLSKGGRKLVAEHYDWPAIGAKLVALHREIGG